MKKTIIAFVGMLCGHDALIGNEQCRGCKSKSEDNHHAFKEKQRKHLRNQERLLRNQKGIQRKQRKFQKQKRIQRNLEKVSKKIKKEFKEIKKRLLRHQRKELKILQQNQQICHPCC